MTLTLIVDSSEFLDALRADVPRATRRVFVQAMTFEGDAAGRSVADLVIASRAPDRRVAVDSYTRFNINDCWVHSPRGLFDAAIRAEAWATRGMMRDLRASGAGVRFTNPMGPLMLRAAARNHKKLVLVDDRVAYIGGINFSDHNFAWRDVMLRIEDPQIVAMLADDFEATWRGENRAAQRTWPGMSLFTLDGPHNAALFAPLATMLREARGSIDVHCCYLTPPFTGWLRSASRRGVRVRVMLPSANNWPDVNYHAEHALARAGADVFAFGDRMTHLKTMVIDERALVVGSANFDFLSYRLHQEFLAIVTDASVVRDFQERVFAPDLERAVRCQPEASSLRASVGHARVVWYERVSRLFYPSLRLASGPEVL